MKKIFYFILLTAELFVSLMLMISLWDVLFYIPIAVSLIVAGLLIFNLVRYFKSADPEIKRRNLINIAISLLIPIGVFVLTYIVIAIIFIFAFV
jgi:hypothetical protein